MRGPWFKIFARRAVLGPWRALIDGLRRPPGALHRTIWLITCLLIYRRRGRSVHCGWHVAFMRGGLASGQASVGAAQPAAVHGQRRFRHLAEQLLHAGDAIPPPHLRHAAAAAAAGVPGGRGLPPAIYECQHTPCPKSCLSQLSFTAHPSKCHSAAGFPALPAGCCPAL